MFSILYYSLAAVLGILAGSLLSGCSDKALGCSKVLTGYKIECGAGYKRVEVPDGFMCCL